MIYYFIYVSIRVCCVSIVHLLYSRCDPLLVEGVRVTVTMGGDVIVCSLLLGGDEWILLVESEPMREREREREKES